MCGPEATVTSLHPPRLCRLAVFSIEPSLLSLKVSGCTGSWRGGWFAFKGCRNHTCCLSLFNEIPAMRHKRGAQVKPKRPWLQNLVMMMVITITARDKTRRGDGEQPCCQPRERVSLSFGGKNKILYVGNSRHRRFNRASSPWVAGRQ